MIFLNCVSLFHVIFIKIHVIFNDDSVDVALLDGGYSNKDNQDCETCNQYPFPIQI